MASDTFTDTNGTLLGDHTSEGVNWTPTFEAVPGTVFISGNEVWSSAFRSSFFLADSTVDSSQIEQVADANVANHSFACVRLTDANDRGYNISFSAQSAGDWIQVNMSKNSSFLTGFTSLSFPVDEPHTLKLTATGGASTVLIASVDDIVIGSFVDSSSPFTTAGDGFGTENNTATGMPTSDNWTNSQDAPVTTFQKLPLLGIGK